jgi:hypothetical protein
VAEGLGLPFVDRAIPMALYHLSIDSTAVSIGGCVELITLAARSLATDPTPA